MSMCVCDQCGDMIDSDNDPDCFVEDMIADKSGSPVLVDKIYCEICRDALGLEDYK